ncbi:MAG: pyridoxamine 5'-phosphate oxidase family protein [Acidobacteria bacterium]|nr:pyridoxamine 5'-phosphate oxidase family protein [Acidobacteriota bacterium]
MNLPGFPPAPAETIRRSHVAELATVTAAGVPLDTPLLSWVGDDGTTDDLSTGLSYPAKAERARREPKVGLLFEGDGEGPVVAMAAYAAVRDADIQANAERYAALTGPMVASLSAGRPWAELREAVWYWARIWLQCTPARVTWWPEGTDRPGTVWSPPGAVVPPTSDPAPTGPPTRAPGWPASDWRAGAATAVAGGPSPHLTAMDEGGFPIPFRVRSVEVTDGGFDLDVPAGAPWALAGPASLCFNGRDTFVGSLEGARLVVDRQLPDLPLVADTTQIFSPSPDVRDALMGRLTAELARRGQPVPVMPEHAPPGFS